MPRKGCQSDARAKQAALARRGTKDKGIIWPHTHTHTHTHFVWFDGILNIGFAFFIISAYVGEGEEEEQRFDVRLIELIEARKNPRMSLYIYGCVCSLWAKRVERHLPQMSDKRIKRPQSRTGRGREAGVRRRSCCQDLVSVCKLVSEQQLNILLDCRQKNNNSDSRKCLSVPQSVCVCESWLREI